MEIYTIHSLGLAKKLMSKGFNLLGVETNKIHFDRVMFMFEDTEEFKRELTLLTEEFNNTKKHRFCPNTITRHI